MELTKRQRWLLIVGVIVGAILLAILIRPTRQIPSPPTSIPAVPG